MIAGTGLQPVPERFSEVKVLWLGNVVDGVANPVPLARGCKHHKPVELCRGALSLSKGREGNCNNCLRHASTGSATELMV